MEIPDPNVDAEWKTILGERENYRVTVTVLLSNNLQLTYRVAHLLREINMLTSNLKFRCWPRSQDKFTAERNFKFGVNISLSHSRWATL